MGHRGGHRPPDRTKLTSWELVEHQADATTVRSMLHVGAFPREYAAITRVLANAGVTHDDLAAALELTMGR